jgi:hypothetical protein
MKRKSTKTTEPKRASLAEMPELTAEQVRRRRPNRHLARAQQSIELVALDKRVLGKLGGATAVLRILQALADALEPTKKKHDAA